MKTCDEIRAIVETSPYWADFVGDGASIPWEWFPPPISLALAEYKASLDAACPEAFRLHDFLYDLRSEGLGITRQEADFCLLEDLDACGVPTAGLVFYVVSTYSEIYFHKVWNPTFSRAHDIPFADPGGSMSTYKATMLLEIATNRSGAATPSVSRVAGWSESWYIEDVTSDEAQAYLLGPSPPGGVGLCQARAGLLPSSGRIVGSRLQLTGTKAPSSTYGRTFPGTSGKSTDTPFMALLCATLAVGGVKARRFTLRGIPDVVVTDGEYAPDGTFATALNLFFNQLGNFSFKGQDTAAPSFPINTIDGTGLLTTNAANTIAVNDMVKVTGALDATNVRRSGTYKVTNVMPLTFGVQLQGWPFGLCSGGNVQLASVAFSRVNRATCEPLRVSSRKVGRPFTGYRGRRSKRKRIA